MSFADQLTVARAVAVPFVIVLYVWHFPGHAYWAIEDPATRKIQRIQFHKNLAMIGGLIFSALDEPRTPSE